ncbi:hypothetical protein NEA19_17120 [Pseudomonas aeruginosa]|uniref:hypothetical protein n=1 Tax=Pseudomonas aeruginosa TaxID=287 RepID=UPI002044A7BD|nr:hypothetical protein [Pseudomonas aeruginosa]MCM3910144.1 hypothetical protein [Pseudomonas aeruginosa]MCM3935657.1 hypothetical protein [Pseudomonas aeruginosa]MCM3947715.1 hypothetical protein [Pseudomonas aeruginosa]MCM3995905.1 hypothetical protein [Pseudomonas aeruginosa]MCM4007256.1 hypothetical protein [Pseudomonas aeruginosa]
MRFEQPSPTIDYRRNMILQALLKIDTLYELTQAASPKLLANIREALTDPDKICEMVTTVAFYYLHREPTVPALYIELVEDGVARHPFTLDEIEAVMNSKIKEVLLPNS